MPPIPLSVPEPSPHPVERGVELPPEFLKFPNKKRIFLIKYSQYGIASHAARLARISCRMVNKWRLKDPAFSAAYDRALEISCDLLELEARRRAYEGVLEPVYHNGERVGVTRRYADTLLMFMLNGNRPQKFRPQLKVDHSSTDGSMTPKPSFDLSKLSIETLRELSALKRISKL